MTSEHGPVYQVDENFEVRDRLFLHAYVWEGRFRWVGNWQDEFWSASAERVGLCSHGEENPTYFSGLVLQQKWEGCLEFMWAKCGE